MAKTPVELETQDIWMICNALNEWASRQSDLVYAHPAADSSKQVWSEGAQEAALVVRKLLDARKRA